MVDPSNHRAGMNVPAIIYPDLLSSINPVSHCPKLPIPTPPERERERKKPSSEENSNSEEGEVIDPDYRGANEERNPYYLNPKRCQQPDQRSWSHKVQCHAFDVKTQTVEFASHRSKCFHQDILDIEHH